MPRYPWDICSHTCRHWPLRPCRSAKRAETRKKTPFLMPESAALVSPFDRFCVLKGGASMMPHSTRVTITRVTADYHYLTCLTQKSSIPYSISISICILRDTRPIPVFAHQLRPPKTNRANSPKPCTQGSCVCARVCMCVSSVIATLFHVALQHHSLDAVAFFFLFGDSTSTGMIVSRKPCF